MTTKLFSAWLVLTSLEFGAVTVYGETAAHVYDGPMQCANGVCVPRRITNGYYPTRWRRWPIEPPVPPAPGVREAIGAPEFELPDPEREADLPEGALTAPSPSDGGAAPPDSAAPRRSGPTTPPPQTAPRTVPRTGPTVPGLPSELQNELPPPRTDGDMPQFPSHDRLPRRGPSLAARPGNRPATMLESAPQDAFEGRPQAHRDSRSAAPNVLHADEADARPLPTLAPAGRRTSHEQIEPGDFARGRTPWASAVEPQQTQAKPAVYEADVAANGGWINAPPNSSAVLETAHSAKNSKPSASASMNQPGRSALLITATDWPATLAVRNIADGVWSSAAQVKNPLRESAAHLTAENSPPAGNSIESASPTIPVNPLRR